MDATHTTDGANGKVRAVVFDRDETLLYFDHVTIAAIDGEIAALLPDMPPDATAQHWVTWPGPWPRTREEEPQFWAVFWEAFAQRYQGAAVPLERLVAVGSRYHTYFRAFDDAAPCLLALTRAGLRLAVLTNFELPSVEHTFTHTGIDPALFDALLSSASIGVAKPHPDAFQAVLAALQLPSEQCAYVDDLPHNVEGAIAVGMRGVLLDRERRHGDWHGERLTSLAALPQLLGCS